MIKSFIAFFLNSKLRVREKSISHKPTRNISETRNEWINKFSLRKDVCSPLPNTKWIFPKIKWQEEEGRGWTRNELELDNASIVHCNRLLTLYLFLCVHSPIMHTHWACSCFIWKSPWEQSTLSTGASVLNHQFCASRERLVLLHLIRSFLFPIN